MAENFALKDMFNQETVKALADAVGQVHPEFSEVDFLTQVFDQNWDDLELKARTRHITIILGGLLPGDYSRALTILNNALPLLAEGGFEKMVFPDYVEVYGLEDCEDFIGRPGRVHKTYLRGICHPPFYREVSRKNPGQDAALGRTLPPRSKKAGQ